MRDRISWKTAPPLWKAGLAGTVPLDRPAVLRFAGDDFIDQLRTELGSGADVTRFLVRAETWRQPAAGLGDPAPTEPPRLYQPVHGRFYLVTGGLVCTRYGLPDKAVDPRCDERAFFVLRRLAPGGGEGDPADPPTHREQGWVVGASGGSWVPLEPGREGRELVALEERLPLFALTYPDPMREPARRRMLAGLVPASARERYEAAVPAVPADVASSDDPGAVLALPLRPEMENVVVGLQAVCQLSTARVLTEPDDNPETVHHYREAAFFALVDLAVLLEANLNRVWSGSPVGADEQALAAVLDRDFSLLAGEITWLEALHTAFDSRDELLSDLPDAPAPIGGLQVVDIAAAIGRLGVAATGDAATQPLFAAVDLALGRPDGARGDGLAGGTDQQQSPLYAIRLGYERPRCPGPERLVLSEPSAPFRLAHFFDPDAPFRPNRIVLPVDTSLDGLRRFPRGVRMEISAQLRRQMDRIQAIKLADLDSGSLPDERRLDLGMVCSFSLPIITICALILLMIVVSLLNLVFFWIPLFKICQPRQEG